MSDGRLHPPLWQRDHNIEQFPYEAAEEWLGFAELYPCRQNEVPVKILKAILAKWKIETGKVNYE